MTGPWLGSWWSEWAESQGCVAGARDDRIICGEVRGLVVRRRGVTRDVEGPGFALRFEGVAYGAQLIGAGLCSGEWQGAMQ